MTTSVYSVDGMTCGHCAAAVTQELSAIPGVSGVSVDLVPGAVSTVTVVSDSPVDAQAIRAAVDEAGYALVG
jgi:copper chaperone CopZ